MKSTTHHVVEFNEGGVDSYHCHIFVLKGSPHHKPTDTTKPENKKSKRSDRVQNWKTIIAVLFSKSLMTFKYPKVSPFGIALIKNSP